VAAAIATVLRNSSAPQPARALLNATFHDREVAASHHGDTPHSGLTSHISTDYPINHFRERELLRAVGSAFW
jgi:hypothetical protein